VQLYEQKGGINIVKKEIHGCYSYKSKRALSVNTLLVVQSGHLAIMLLLTVKWNNHGASLKICTSQSFSKSGLHYL
jgi:hypothetical protein